MTRCVCRYDGSKRHPGCDAHIEADVERVMRTFDSGHDFNVIAGSRYMWCLRCGRYYLNDPNEPLDPCPWWDRRHL